MSVANDLNECLGHDRNHGPAHMHRWDGEDYVILTGTGDASGADGLRGCWAYLASDVDAWLELDHGEDSSYQHLCDHVDVETDEDLARSLLDDDLLLNIPGTCRPVLGYVVHEYAADGCDDGCPYVSQPVTLERAREIVAQRLKLHVDKLEQRRWPGIGADVVAAYHASDDEGCGGYDVVRL